MNDGTYLEVDGRPAVRFERVYPHSVERVWAAITEPDELQRWFPSRVTLDPRVGGRVLFSGDPYADDHTGTVLVWEPPHRLAFTWGDEEVHFQLEATPDESCRFVLLDYLAASNAAARNASGWTVCLGELDKLIAGTPGSGPHSDDTPRFQPIYEHYVAAGLPHGAAIPDIPGM